MKKVVARLLGEPLFHFLLFGALLFAVDTLYSNRKDRLVVVSEQEIRNYLKANAYRGKIPDSEDSLRLTEKLITKKILLAEAYKRRFDRYDPVVKERLIDRMQLALIQDTVPNDRQALEYYRQHTQRYQQNQNPALGYEAVKSQVLNDLMMKLREESYSKNLQDLRQQYTVRVEKP